MALSKTDSALIELGRQLKARGYHFTTPTPATHARVNSRPENKTGNSLEAIFGWSRPFDPAFLPHHMLRLLDESNALETTGNWLKSKVRFSTLGQLLLVHSQFPTTSADAVFFGPDTYRFARALRAALAAWPGWKPKRIFDIGSGTGAGGFYARSLLPDDPELVLGDVNDAALRFAAINAAINEVINTKIVRSDVLADIEGNADFIIANPPYLVDPDGRVYRHGGGKLGFDLSVRILTESLSHLTPDGQMLLYTGAPIIDGEDQFFVAVEPVLKSAGRAFTYEELDPDVFGEELEQDSYARTDRIAVVALNLRMRKKG